MTRARRFASVVAILVIVLIGFVTIASFAVTRAANRDGVVARAAQTAVLSVAGGVASVATGAARLAGHVTRTAEMASDGCASVCAPDGGTTANNQIASAPGAVTSCSFAREAHRIAFSERGDKQCSFGKSASYLASNSQGDFMGRLASACQSECSARDVTPASVVAQPDAQPGDVTQCPVSGAVFAVRDNHPGWVHGGTTYYTCCGTCAGILAENPKRFLEIESG